ncbi:MAG: hypothetical protein LIP77_06765 [Planctomycetes bacterium]|nr:hypothetical protein [Planctomycetota bacterium]
MRACDSEFPDAQPAVRIAVVPGAEPADWRPVYDRLNRCSQRLEGFLLTAAAAAATFAGLFGTAGGMAAVILRHFPDIAAPLLAGAVILPGMLVGAAAGQAGGNLFMRLRYRLDDATRRGFATRLGLSRAPEGWHAGLRRWLFTGDWLGTPAYDLRLPYVRIFIVGDAPDTCRDEDAIWREIHGQISGDSLWEAGTNIREISYPHTLPGWAREVSKGDGFADLQRRIGRTEATEWVMHLWRRACRQWPALGANDYPEQARRECFEMHSLFLADGRQALVVVLRPVAFVRELEVEGEKKGLAA